MSDLYHSQCSTEKKNCTDRNRSMVAPVAGERNSLQRGMKKIYGGKEMSDTLWWCLHDSIYLSKFIQLHSSKGGICKMQIIP